jgi:hypothetical protein
VQSVPSHYAHILPYSSQLSVEDHWYPTDKPLEVKSPLDSFLFLHADSGVLLVREWALNLLRPCV